tara:strand:+ start:162 stop:380 length:219 start_codon:yes stop_codon:yes gene_type:complete
MWILVDFVNLVNYIEFMSDKYNKINSETGSPLANKLDENHNKAEKGIYLRDDHCDWGSSGMNEFTNEFGVDK